MFEIRLSFILFRSAAVFVVVIIRAAYVMQYLPAFARFCLFLKVPDSEVIAATVACLIYKIAVVPGHAINIISPAAASNAPMKRAVPIKACTKT